MTAPVFMDQGDQGAQTMSFVLPSSFDFRQAPVPKDPDVRLEEVSDYTVAAIVFSGLFNQDNINKHRARLEDWIAARGYESLGSVRAAGYNPPFTIPALRRNEVLISVKKP